MPDCVFNQYDPELLYDTVDSIHNYVVNISSDLNTLVNTVNAMRSEMSSLDLSYLATLNQSIQLLLEQNDKLQGVNMRLWCHLAAQIIKEINGGDAPVQDLNNDKRNCYTIYKDNDGNYSQDIFEESVDESDDGYLFRVEEDTW